MAETGVVGMEALSQLARERFRLGTKTGECQI
jgi:hypothetical protein